MDYNDVMSKIYILVLFLRYISCDQVLNPYFHFPDASDPFMGLIVTIAVPLDLKTPGDVIYSVILEANYNLPKTQTRFAYPPIVGDSAAGEGRGFIYTVLERKFEEKYGFSGKDCLLRTICEASQHPTGHTGVLGDVVQILLSPSMSAKEKNMTIYEDAELQGISGSCHKYTANCSISILSSLSQIGDFIDKIINPE